MWGSKTHKKTANTTKKHCAPNKSLHRPRRGSRNTPDNVARFIADVELLDPLPRAAFEESLVNRFGTIGEAYLAAQSSHDGWYPAKAVSLDLALAVNSQAMGDRHEAFLSWFVGANLPTVKRVLDVGCDIGVLTCYYARFFPDAEVIGIDRCPESIACAKQLAAKLQLSNVQFHVADVLNLPQPLAGQTFDLVVSQFVTHEIASPFHRAIRSVEQAMSEPLNPDLLVYAQTLSSVLAARTGTLVTFERIIDPATLAEWSQALSRAGIGIGSAGLLASREWDEPEGSSPLLVGIKDQADVLGPDDIRVLWMNVRTFARYGA